MPKLGLGVLALAPVAMVGLAGCGGSGGGALSRSEFVAKADALCRASNRTPPPGPAHTAQDAVRNTQREVRERTRLRAELAKLKPPSQLKRLFARYQAQTDAIVALYRQEIAAAQASDVRRFNQIDQRVTTLAAQRAKTGGQIGFRVCGGAVSPQAAADPALVRTVDAACTAANHTAQTATPQPKGPTDTAAFARIGPGILAAQRQALGVIRAQAPSPRVKALYGQFSAAFSDRTDITARQLAAARAKDGRKLQSLTTQDEQIASRREAPAAQRLGFEVCGILGENGV